MIVITFIFSRLLPADHRPAAEASTARSDPRSAWPEDPFPLARGRPAFHFGRPTGRKPVVDGHTTSWISTERVAFRSSCEARLRGNGGAGAAELKVGGCTNKESGFDSLFLLVDGLSIVDIITLFTSAALGLVASCMDAWSLRSSSSCSTATSWRLRRLMGHGRWINGRFCQGCTGIGSVCALVPDVWSGLDTFRYI